MSIAAAPGPAARRSWAPAHVLAGALLTAALAAALLVPAGAAAAQHQNANIYSYWDWNGSGFWNVDQDFRIDKKAPSTYWAMYMTWKDTGGSAYMGVQTNGGRFDGSVGDTAIFSIWDANGTRGSTCGTFGGEGTGLSCRIPFSASLGTYYRLRIWRQEADSHGQWWGAWIENESSGSERFIGSIRAPRGATSIDSTMNFVEYFGDQVPCNKVPQSKVVWTQPAANLRGSVYEHYSSYGSAHFGSCVTGSAAPVDLGWTSGVLIFRYLYPDARPEKPTCRVVPAVG